MKLRIDRFFVQRPLRKKILAWGLIIAFSANGLAMLLTNSLTEADAREYVSEKQKIPIGQLRLMKGSCSRGLWGMEERFTYAHKLTKQVLMVKSARYSYLLPPSVVITSEPSL